MENTTNLKSTNFSQRLLAWFEQYGRSNLPWQKNQTPYRVWLSEIMLQQTQVKTVIPFYNAFISAFPDIASLAQAEEDQVLHLWTGLGYYARARNLHKTAKIVHTDNAGKFPDTLEGLCMLPGIGRSTAGAILSLAFKQRAVILDGNVKRVLCRYHCVEGWPAKPSVQKQLWELAEQHTPLENCAHYTQAIMDLGATLCTRSKPACPICPLEQHCQAYNTNTSSLYPHKKPKKVIPVRHTHMLIFYNQSNNTILLEKRPPQGIWGGLWSFPEAEDASTLTQDFHNQIMIKDTPPQLWQPIRHTFSHFHLDITPVVLPIDHAHIGIMENSRLHWYDLQNPSKIGLAAPVKKLLSALEKTL